MHDYKLGIIGGMGPEATADFFSRIVKKTDASSDQEHINIIILNHCTIPDRTKTIESKDYKPLLAEIIKDAKLLEKNGVKAIAIPCNTSHFFYKEIQSQVSTPIINMIEESIKFVVQNYGGIDKIGILATNGTIKSKIYENECKKYGIEVILPSEQSQKALMDIIYNEIKKDGKGNLESFMKIVNELKEAGCQAIVIACTELSYFKNNFNIPEYCVDAMDILVERSITMAGKKIRKDNYSTDQEMKMWSSKTVS